jgi:hypothetical protein
VNSVQLGKKMGRHGRKDFRALVTEMLLPRQFGKQALHLSIDVFGITECVPLFGYPHGSD